MTINVAVKCPDGIVLGADGLVTIPGLEVGTVASMVPYFTKLFEIKGYAAGAMINGTGSIGGRTIEDVISEFNESNIDTNDTSNYSLQELSVRLGDMVNATIQEYKKPVSLEVIVGGYSIGEKARGRRYGEIYSLRWKKPPTSSSTTSNINYDIRPVYPKDRQFGTHYGGQPKILDRFIYGIDDLHLTEMWKGREALFRQAEQYILKQLKDSRIKIPKNFFIEAPKNLADFNIYNLISTEHELKGTGTQIIKNVKENMKWKLPTMEGYFSLQTAVNYCSFLMWCAYAENAFTLVLPTVGSEMRIATITRIGFKLIKQWEIQSPGPPFR